ncbi:uncharacterized protein LOC127528322 [Erpetoichthys calabaricus]|uniref:uncharacterized protein LOC127528322 n=1 Tax=Erpetoichthys calabaricus TaxID=27687 RepID=UPI002234869C|nr:uncharacterized protein LOC127528322 [Erpetoichthys calabaricus]
MSGFTWPTSLAVRISWMLRKACMVREPSVSFSEGTTNQLLLLDMRICWCRVSVSSYYLTDCLLLEYKRQEPAIKKLLQGTFGQALCSDHTRIVARKVTFTSGTMSSYTVMSENWMIISWIMLQSETDKSLEPMYQGLANQYRIGKTNFQWVDRDCCSAFRVAESLQVEHLDWNAWKTTDSIVAQAIHGYLLNRCASRTMYNKNIIIKLDLFHCMRETCSDSRMPMRSVELIQQILPNNISVIIVGQRY